MWLLLVTLKSLISVCIAFLLLGTNNNSSLGTEMGATFNAAAKTRNYPPVEPGLIYLVLLLPLKIE